MIKSDYFDIELALKYCGGMEDVLLEVYKLYIKQSEDYLKNIEAFVQKEDLNDYIIVTHALKNASINIGQKDFSEQSKAMEMAGRNGDREYINTHFQEYLKYYIEVVERVKEFLENPNGSEMPRSQISENANVKQKTIVILNEDSASLVRMQELLRSSNRIVPMKALPMLYKFLEKNDADIVVLSGSFEDKTAEVLCNINDDRIIVLAVSDTNTVAKQVEEIL